MVEVGGEGDHVGEEARQGAKQGEGGEEEGGEGAPEQENEIKSQTSFSMNKKGGMGQSSQG